MIRLAILTVSDSAFAGRREDLSGPALRQRAEELGWSVVMQSVVSDELLQIQTSLRSILDSGNIDLILTTGGTGIAVRDVTPEATRKIIDREIPGLPELMRADGRRSTRFAPLSRAAAGTSGSSLIVNLPGSPKGAVESLNAIANLVPHMVDLLHGRTEHDPSMRN